MLTFMFYMGAKFIKQLMDLLNVNYQIKTNILDTNI